MKHVQVVNPYDQAVVLELPFATWDETLDAVERARRAQSGWAETPVGERVRLVREGMRYFAACRETVAAEMTRHMGKPIAQSRNEIDGMFERANHLCDIAAQTLQSEVLPPKANFEREITHEPLGVVLDIAAWNYPLLIAVNVVVPALLSGNTVLVKHSSRTPLCGEHFARALGCLGAHRDLVQNLILNHASVCRLIASGGIDFVSFTGSVKGGHEVYEAAAKQFIDVSLELGGKDPAYVAADADLEHAAANLVDGAMYNAGQSCCGIERVYVHESLYQSFLERCLPLVSGYTLGDPMDEKTNLGPLASRGSLDTLDRQIGEAVARGARLLSGGRRRFIGQGNFFEPTLLADIPDHRLSVMQEENFGPLLPVMKVNSDDEALALMNDSRYGLTAAVWTRSTERARRFGRQLRVGTVYMNRCDYLDPALPWVGVKDSGKGISLSKYGFYGLTRRKSLHFRVKT